ncbi:hypothetical protein [Nostoc punctiforme]|uniref:hypothetical protein n=1 Tax=Nostoc punctiforme TaxID=272131 RepID=UPI0002E7DFDD|nr:hypothetical protein [Nostoc punctiforme]
MQQEYARLAKETGGQAFSDRDSLSGFIEVLQKVICNSRTEIFVETLQCNVSTKIHISKGLPRNKLSK